jgi:hypothetical protein
VIRPPEQFEFDKDAARCPRCAKRLDADASVCPACGYELVTRHRRIRCAHCGHRVYQEATLCPHCAQDPHPKPIPRTLRLGALIAMIVIVCACAGWVAFRTLTTDVVPRALKLNEPTSVPTQLIQVLFIVATPPAPTPTILLAATTTPTRLVTPTPTRRGARAATAAPTAPPPAPANYSAPQLIAPLNTLIFNGASAQVDLQWQPVSSAGLREYEWYAITVSYTGRDTSPVTQTRWMKETHWTVPSTWWSEVSLDARTFRWQVGVVRVNGIDPFTSTSRMPVSPNSALRTFIWN